MRGQHGQVASMLDSQSSSPRCECTVLRGTQHQFSENICSQDDLRSRIFGTFVVKFLACLPPLILGGPGADSGDEEKSKRVEKYMARRKVKNGEKSPWGQCLTRPVPSFSGTNQKPERRRPFGTGLVRHCPQGLFLPFFTFLRAIYFSARLDFSSSPLSALGLRGWPPLGFSNI